MKEFFLMLSPFSIIILYSVIEIIKKKKEKENSTPSLKKSLEEWKKKETVNEILEFYTFKPIPPLYINKLGIKYVVSYKEKIRTSFDQLSGKGYMWYRKVEKFEQIPAGFMEKVPHYKVSYFYLIPQTKKYTGENLEEYAEKWFEKIYIGAILKSNLSDYELKQNFLMTLFPSDPPFPPDKPPSIMSGGIL